MQWSGTTDTHFTSQLQNRIQVCQENIAEAVSKEDFNFKDSKNNYCPTDRELKLSRVLF